MALLVSNQSERPMTRLIRSSATQTQNSLARFSLHIFSLQFFSSSPLLPFSFSTLSKDSARQHLFYSGILSDVHIRLSIADPCDIEVRRVGFSYQRFHKSWLCNDFLRGFSPLHRRCQMNHTYMIIYSISFGYASEGKY